jgi:hypothetical protein
MDGFRCGGHFDVALVSPWSSPIPLKLMVTLPLNVRLNPVAYFTEQGLETEMKWAIENIEPSRNSYEDMVGRLF